MINIAVSADGTELTATISVIDEDGEHIDPDDWPISNDPDIVLSSHPSASKTVTKLEDGVYTAVWTGLSPALTHLQIVRVTIDGEIDTEAWSTYVATHQVMLPTTKTDLPANFDQLGINSSGHVSRVTLVDTTTANTDMRGTDNALTSLGANAPAGWIDEDAVAESAVSKLQDGLIIVGSTYRHRNIDTDATADVEITEPPE